MDHLSLMRIPIQIDLLMERTRVREIPISFLQEVDQILSMLVMFKERNRDGCLSLLHRQGPKEENDTLRRQRDQWIHRAKEAEDRAQMANKGKMEFHGEIRRMTSKRQRAGRKEECTTLKDKEIEDEMWPNEYAFIQQNFTSGCTQSQHVTQELKRVAKKARRPKGGKVALLKDKVVTVQSHGLEKEAQL